MYLGLDLGATNLHVMVADRTAVRGRVRTLTPNNGAIAEAVRAAVHESCDQAGCDATEIETAGIATVGPLENGYLRNPANLPDADGLDLRSVVGDVVGSAELAQINDASAAAIAEAEVADTEHLVFLTLSTGVGAGVIAGGQPLHGCRGNAGEVGHIELDSDTGLECGCGKMGHWEALCGGANLATHARAIAAEGVETGLALEELDPETLLSNGGADPLATALVERLGKYNSRGAALLVAVYDPARLVIGGGLALNHPETLLEPIRSGLSERCLREPPPIDLAHYGDEAPVHGALALARRRDRNR